MLTIVGGTYREICVHPSWDQLYGSGLRAATACSELLPSNSITLHTWISNQDRQELKYRAQSYGINFVANKRHDSIEFHYEHPLSRPTVYPWQNRPKLELGKPIRTENALIFGLLETECKVEAERIVYDPQASQQTKNLFTPHNHVDALCTVANLKEAECLAKSLKIDYRGSGSLANRLARAILRKSARHRNDVIIIKNGAYGATVCTKDSVAQIPSYRTDSVFKIGSGDVFSAVFAALWAAKRMEPVAAAQIASRSVAYYCNTASLPVPKDLDLLTSNYIANPILKGRKTPHRIYLAGPLFNVPERWFVSETKRCLEDCGLTVFSPLHDVGTGGTATYLAKKDLKGLDSCDLVFALLDGLDTGTIFEIGYARARRKPIIAYGERVHESDLTMLKGTGAKFFNDYCTAIYQATWHAMSL